MGDDSPADIRWNGRGHLSSIQILNFIRFVLRSFSMINLLHNLYKIFIYDIRYERNIVFICVKLASLDTQFAHWRVGS